MQFDSNLLGRGMFVAVDLSSTSVQGVNLPIKKVDLPTSTQWCWGGHSYNNGTPQLLDLLPPELRRRFVVHDLSDASGRRMLELDPLFHYPLLEEIQAMIYTGFDADPQTEDPSLNAGLQGVHALRTWLIPEKEMPEVQGVIDATLEQGVDFEDTVIPLEQLFPGTSVYIPPASIE